MAQLNGQDISIFALGSSKELSEKIANYVGVPLSKVESGHFADGEVSIDIKESVRGHHCFIIQSTNAPVNEHYMELFIMIDALKRASARTINVIMPYYGYSRQDRKAGPRQPITSKLVADLLTTAGATRVLSMDLHAAQIQGFFNIPIDNFQGLPVFVSYIKKHIDTNNMVIVSPDHGGATRARKFANYFSNAPIAIIDKRRPRPNACEVMSIIGEVEGKVAVLVDDMVDTAGSAVAAVSALKKAGATEIYMCATHGLLSGPAIERIANSDLKKLVISDTVSLPEEKKIDKIDQISVAKIFGQAIINVLTNQPVSDLFSYDPNKELSLGE
ncbi:MAG: ribose-phosphate pyrophosphokinase [Bacilli bacterium]|nr:ribose-phosphate pyrophosphokinase [Bacilli bacterium]